ncbi:MAG: Cell-division-associated, ABC-transporter-like signaling protein FtsE, partial [uncultured Acidimicrobiales bacterium]
DQARERHQELQGRCGGPARCDRRDPEGRVRLPGRPLGLGQVHLHPPPQQGGGPRGRPHLGGGQGHRRPQPREDPLPAPQHRLHLPGLQAAAHQERVRERGLRPRGDRPAPPRHLLAGARHPRARRARQEDEEPAARAVGRRAAARVHRPGLREPAADPPGRRAHRQPRPHDVRWDHAPPRPHQPHGHHGRHGHPRPGHRRHDAPPRDRARPRRDRARPGARGLRL